MGEVSESLHLRSENPKDAVALLKRAEVAGFVFPPRNGWVSIACTLSSEDRFMLEQENKGLLLFYEYSADHGCWVNLHEGKKRIARISAPFAPGQPAPVFDRTVFEKLELVVPAGAAAIAEWVKRAHVWHERQRTPYLVAERLHLPRYQIFSYARELGRPDPDPDRIAVSADGKVKYPPKKPEPHGDASVIPEEDLPGAKPKRGAAKKTPAKKGAAKPKKGAAKPKKGAAKKAPAEKAKRPSKK